MLGVFVWCSIALSGQAPRGLDAAKLLKPGTDSWPTYNGDYSGRRFSTLDKINASNVDALTLAWVFRHNAGPGLPAAIKGTPLQINGVIYLTAPDHVWALDARTGREIWHHTWQSTGGIHIGNRGAAVLGESLYFETPDCHLVSLNIKDGIRALAQADLRSRPVLLRLGRAGHRRRTTSSRASAATTSTSPATSRRTIPRRARCSGGGTSCRRRRAIPGSETWPNEEAMKHGGGMTWQPVTYDPDLNLIYVTTGNPQPVIAHSNRAGANLFTASIVALNPDTGKMAWYFQSSPHDTHDWDSTQTPVLFDGEINGQPRKLLAQAARNGHFFVLDRTTGKALVSSEYVKTNWSSGYDEKGQPIPNPAKHPQVDGALVTPDQGGATNWPPPSFSPQTGLVLRQRCARLQRLLPLRPVARTRRGGAAPIAAGGRSR